MRIASLLVAAMLASGPSTPAHAPELTLSDAVVDGNVAEVARRVALGEPQVAPLGETALMLACEVGTLPVIDWLLAHGAPVDQATASGQTALMVAAAAGDLAAVDRLLAAGAAIDARTETGDTALMVAVLRNRTSVVRRFLARHARLDAADVLGKTALDLAILRLRPDLVADLLAHGARLTPDARPALADMEVQMGGLLGLALPDLRGGATGRPWDVMPARVGELAPVLAAAARGGANGHGVLVSAAFSAAYNDQPALLQALLAHGVGKQEVWLNDAVSPACLTMLLEAGHAPRLTAEPVGRGDMIRVLASAIRQGASPPADCDQLLTWVLYGTEVQTARLLIAWLGLTDATAYQHFRHTHPGLSPSAALKPYLPGGADAP